MRENIVNLLLKLSHNCCIEERLTINAKFSAKEIFAILILKEGASFTVSSLAKALNLSLSRTSRIVNSMAKKGLILYREDENDRRNLFLCLTKDGEKVFKKIEEAKQKCEDEIVGKLDKKEVELIILSLNKLISVL